jgi:hypothetical protein
VRHLFYVTYTKVRKRMCITICDDKSFINLNNGLKFKDLILQHGFKPSHLHFKLVC